MNKLNGLIVFSLFFLNLSETCAGGLREASAAVGAPSGANPATLAPSAFHGYVPAYVGGVPSASAASVPTSITTAVSQPAAGMPARTSAAGEVRKLSQDIQPETQAIGDARSSPETAADAADVIAKAVTGEKPHVVIVGGGFGGVAAAQALSRHPVRVTLLDRTNYHLFQPLLYQVATGGLPASHIAQPLRQVLKNSPNVRVMYGEAVGVDLEGRRLLLADGELTYDRLILAAGVRPNYFGHPEWAQHAPPLKGVEDALEIRRRILTAFELAEKESDERRRKDLLTFVVIGGGPTGVELAGAISELSREYRGPGDEKPRIIIVEGAPRILSFLDHTQAQDEALMHTLTQRGIEVRTGTLVTGIKEGLVETKNGDITAGTILWAAGIEASPLSKTLGSALDKSGRVEVLPDLSIAGHPEASVIGDLAVFKQDGKPLPGLAAVAIQMGRHAAKNILLSLTGQVSLPFSYRDRGVIAVLGRHAAFGHIGRIHLAGLFGWLAWIIIHVSLVRGWHNRIAVAFEWAWTYLTGGRNNRIIIKSR